MDKIWDVLIVGGGPCGVSAAIYCDDANLSTIVLEKGNIMNTLYHFPTHQMYFSTSEKLEIGNIAFITENRKPNRLQSLSYYREVVKRKKVNVKTHQFVKNVTKIDDYFMIDVMDEKEEIAKKYYAKNVVIATGYYDNPNRLGVPGQDLSHVSHYFKEGHHHFGEKVTVIGGKNSSVDASLELVKCGAEVTVLYRGKEYSSSIKPWILPEFEALVRTGEIKMEFEAHVKEITAHSIKYVRNEKEFEIPTDFVYAMIGYHPNHKMLKAMGVDFNVETGRPFFDELTMETNVPGIFIAGVIAAGNNANEIFIENGKFHGEHIAKEIKQRLEK